MVSCYHRDVEEQLMSQVLNGLSNHYNYDVNVVTMTPEELVAVVQIGYLAMEHYVLLAVSLCVPDASQTVSLCALNVSLDVQQFSLLQLQFCPLCL